MMTHDSKMDSADKTNELTVFFDGDCPLCTREIAFYRRRKGAEHISWVDVSQCADSQLGPDLLREDVLTRFHVKHADGRIISGGRAFADLWAELPSMAPIGHLFKCWPLSIFLDVAYRIFLPLRPWLQMRLKPKE